MSKARGNPSGWRVDSGLMLVALVWGATFVLVKQALHDVSTLLFLTLRFSCATGALLILLGPSARAEIRAGKSLRTSVWAGILAGCCLFAGYVLQTFGLKYTTPAKAGFLTGLYIPLVPLFSSLLYRKPPRALEALGVICAFGGMALMTVHGELRSIGPGDLLVTACAAAYAFHILVLGKFAAQCSVAVLTVVQIATGALLGALTFWWVEPPRIAWTGPVWLAVLVTSLLATAFAFAIQTWAQQYSSPTRTALIFSLEPVFAWVTSYLLEGEVLTGKAMAGAGLILAGILLVEVKPPGLAQHSAG